MRSLECSLKQLLIIPNLVINITPGPIKDKNLWKLTFMTFFSTSHRLSSTWAKREQESLRACSKSMSSAWELEAKPERAFELTSTLMLVLFASRFTEMLRAYALSHIKILCDYCCRKYIYIL